MKTSRLLTVVLTSLSLLSLTGCGNTNDYTYKDITFSVSNDYKYEESNGAYVFISDNARIVVTEKESTLQNIIDNNTWINDYDVEYKTDNIKINGIDINKIYLEQSRQKDGIARFTSIEYTFKINNTNYKISASDIMDTIDIKPIEEELENLINSIETN